MLIHAFLLAGSAAGLLLSAETISLAGGARATAAPLHLICQGGRADPFCAALAGALAADTGRNVVVVQTDQAASQDHIRFISTHQDPDRISGRLSWALQPAAAGNSAGNDTGNRIGEGPELELSVMDADIAPDMLRAFAEQMIRHSALPL